jgi:thymidylate synthase (FAD)
MVNLISFTEPGEDLKSLGVKTGEDLIVYIARVSNPSNQTNMETAPGLLKYLIKHKHWSPFEHVSATLRITTSRAIAAQILRHRSFTFQEFSQRYSEAVDTEPVEFRAQGKTNRQVGEEPTTIPQHLMDDFNRLQWDTKRLYRMLLDEGVARECARMVLPLNTTTTIYMTGTLRSWIHYIQLRNTPETQKEHREIAFDALKILEEKFPNTFKVLNELFKYDQ